MSRIKTFPPDTTRCGCGRENNSYLSHRVNTIAIMSSFFAILMLLLTSVDVQAQTTSDNEVKLSARPQSGVAGTIFSFSAQNFAPDETIATYVRWPEDYNFTEADVLFKVDDSGTAGWTWDSTGVPSGNYTMVVVSQTNPERSASLVFTVLSNNANSKSSQLRSYNFTSNRTRLQFFPREQIG